MIESNPDSNPNPPFFSLESGSLVRTLTFLAAGPELLFSQFTIMAKGNKIFLSSFAHEYQRHHCCFWYYESLCDLTTVSCLLDQTGTCINITCIITSIPDVLFFIDESHLFTLSKANNFVI